MNFNATMSIPAHIKQDLPRLEHGISRSFNKIKNDVYKIEIFSDALLTGWGVCCNEEKTHGCRAQSDKKHYINYL